jgi:AraC-like DNA-binding protein
MTPWIEPATVPLPPVEGGFLMKRRAPSPVLRNDVVEIIGYQEYLAGHFRQIEFASLVVPLIVSFGDPFAIGLGRLPGKKDLYGSFAAGLFGGPVFIDSFGAASCVQVNFTPPGAYRFFDLPMHELADRMVALDDICGSEAIRLRNQLGEEADWERRFDLIEAFIEQRLAGDDRLPSATARAYSELVRTAGAQRIEAIAAKLDWSRKHLAAKFRAEIGLTPKTVGRMARFNRALRLARRRDDGGWAGIAVECGYADQAHLAREFSEFAGETPTAWQARLA